MSSNPDQILTASANRIAGHVLDMVGTGDVLSVFVAGSVARGEVAGFVKDGFAEVYSDVDLYVVVSDGVDLERTRRTIREFAARLPRESASHRIFPKPDVGVYSEVLLRSQGARPGTVDIKTAHRVLSGRTDIGRWIEDFSPSAIDPAEGLYLIENRLSELVDIFRGARADGTAGYRRYVHYTLIKSCQDLLSALLCVIGRYSASRSERMAYSRTREFRERARDLITDKMMEMAEWSDSSLTHLADRITIDGTDLEAVRGDVESVLLTGWRRMAIRLFGGRDRWADLIARRCSQGEWWSNSKDVLVLGRRMSVPRAGLAVRLGLLGRWSPMDAVRLSGLVDVLFQRGSAGGVNLESADRGDLVRGYIKALDRLTRCFGVRKGSVFERGRSLFGKVA